MDGINQLKNNKIIGDWFKLPSGNLIKVTALVTDKYSDDLVTSVYVANRDPSLKRLVVSRKWFDIYAVPV